MEIEFSEIAMNTPREYLVTFLERIFSTGRRVKLVVVAALLTGIFSTAEVQANAVGAQEPQSATTVTRIAAAQFGILKSGDNDQLILVPASEITKTVGVTYGYLIKLSPMTQEIKFREELTVLTESPEAGAGPVITSRDGVIRVDDNTLAGAWKIDPSDTLGKYLIKIYFDNRLVQTFEFRLMKANKDNQQQQGASQHH